MTLVLRRIYDYDCVSLLPLLLVKVKGQTEIEVEITDLERYKHVER